MSIPAHRNSQNQRHMAGFTLIEILVVIVILAVLATFIAPNILGKPQEARITKAQSDLQALETALSLYRLDNFHYPSTDQGLEALVTKPSGSPSAKNWRADGYLKRLRNDPWGEPYQYLLQGNKIVLFSVGPDGTPSDDDIKL